MTRSFFCCCCSVVCLLLLLESSGASASSSTTDQIPPSKICRSTPYPSSCSEILPANNASAASVYDYGRTSLRKSISAARRFLSLVNRYLAQSNGLTVTAVRALQDCQFLAQSSIDYLLSSSQIVSQTSQFLTPTEGDQVQTLLSAIITNAQTCIDGLQATASAWSVRNGILVPLSNDTRLYSVSLALVSKGWVPNKVRRWPNDGNGNAPAVRKKLKMRNGKKSVKDDHVHRNLISRRLLQVIGGGDEVLVSDTVVVSQDGSGNFTTINDAVIAATVNANRTNGFFLIYVTAGVYEEYVFVPKSRKYVMMVGDGINRTIITGNHSVGDGWTTFSSSTFTVAGMGFVAMNLTFRNTAGAIKQQAVAVRNSADLSTFYSCSFEGYQDTLYAHSLRQFYSQCDIYGTVDFIFGNAAAVYQDCNIYPRQPMPGQFNSVTAQGRTDPNQNTGFSIQNCSVRPADDLANSAFPVQTYLGRPWKLYSRAVYMNSFMDSLINPAGWSIWNGDFALNTSYYAEFGNSGPGSDSSQRVKWDGFHVINSTEAEYFTASAFLIGDEWLPETGVPYTGGLS